MPQLTGMLLPQTPTPYQNSTPAETRNTDEQQRQAMPKQDPPVAPARDSRSGMRTTSSVIAAIAAAFGAGPVAAPRQPPPLLRSVAGASSSIRAR